MTSEQVRWADGRLVFGASMDGSDEGGEDRWVACAFTRELAGGHRGNWEACGGANPLEAGYLLGRLLSYATGSEPVRLVLLMTRGGWAVEASGPSEHSEPFKLCDATSKLPAAGALVATLDGRGLVRPGSVMASPVEADEIPFA